MIKVILFDKKEKILSVKNSESNEFIISSEVWWKHGLFLAYTNQKEVNIIEKLEKEKPTLNEIADIFYGIKAYQVGKGNPPQTKKTLAEKPFTSKEKCVGCLPFFSGRDVDRYKLLWNDDNWIRYGEWLAEPRNPKKFEGEKLLVRKIVGNNMIATYIPHTSYCNTLLYVIKLNEDISIGYRYLLGIINSSLMGWYFRKKFQISAKDTFPQILRGNLIKFPILISKAVLHHRLNLLVKNMLELHNRDTQTPYEHEQLEHEIATTDTQINRLVYDLYGLTDEEIRIVEG